VPGDPASVTTTPRAESRQLKPLWPTFKTKPWTNLPRAASSLWLLPKTGKEVLLLEFDFAKFKGPTRAPGIVGESFRATIDEPDTGLTYVEVFASGFDLDGNGLADCLVGISGDGNLCEFSGQYYILFSQPDNTTRASEAFAGCSTYSGFKQLSSGSLQITFASPPGEYVATVSPDGHVTGTPPADDPQDRSSD
jgi:hypothetical protein